MQKETGHSGSTNASSLIDLKAELFRKQEEFKNQKLQSQNASYIKGKPSGAPNKKPNIFSRKNAGVAKRSEKDYEEKKEEEDVFERSKRALENKAKLYEKIASGTEIPEEDGSDFYLVDFQKKVIDDVMERREKERQEREDREKREAEEDRRVLEEPAPPAENEEDEWVDFVDSLGRSRRCLRKDLPGLQQADKKLQTARGVKEEDTPGLLSGDMRREIERKKWEEEKMEKEKEGPIHYADVQHKEIRTHGVGFYQFDKEETLRQEQMDQLKKLRDETKDERSKRERIKEKRKAALAARLAKVKQRKREKLGLPEEDEEGNASSEEEIGPKPAEQAEIQSKLEPEPLTRDDSWRKMANLTREWDRGKEKITERSEKSWLERQRAERETEFAPPSFYYEESKPHPHHIQTNQKSIFKRPFQEQETVTEISRDPSDSGEADETGETAKGVVEDRGSRIVADVILKRLRQYRGDGESAEMVSSSEQSTSDFSVYANLQHTQVQPSTDGSAIEQYTMGSFSTLPPPLHLHQQASPAIPDPRLPVPNVLNVPPPSFSVPAHDFSVPPPNFNVPPPNLSIPPPNMTYPPPSYPVQNSDQADPVSHEVQGLQSSAPFHQTDPHQTSAPSQPAPSKQKRIIPKLDIIDTRLMENEDD